MADNTLEETLRKCQIDSATGLTHDYRNAYAGLISAWRIFSEDERIDFIKSYPPKTYTETYSQRADSEFFFNEKYGGSIARIDELAEEFRKINPEKLTYQHLIDTYTEVDFLITRKTHK